MRILFLSVVDVVRHSIFLFSVYFINCACINVYTCVHIYCKSVSTCTYIHVHVYLCILEQNMYTHFKYMCNAHWYAMSACMYMYMYLVSVYIHVHVRTCTCSCHVACACACDSCLDVHACVCTCIYANVFIVMF